MFASTFNQGDRFDLIQTFFDFDKMFELEFTLSRNFFFYPPPHTETHIQIEFQMDSKKICDGIFHVFEGLLSNNAKNKPL